MTMTYKLTIPIPEKTIRSLQVGDTVYLSGVIITARDAAHKYMVEKFIESDAIPASERPIYEELRRLLNGGIIYHHTALNVGESYVILNPISFKNNITILIFLD